jgi:cell wall assembly regulator SMI1
VDVDALRRAWSRLETWLNRHELDGLLLPGASAERVRKLGSDFHCTLPDSLAWSLRRHDGQDTAACNGLFRGSGDSRFLDDRGYAYMSIDGEGGLEQEWDRYIESVEATRQIDPYTEVVGPVRRVHASSQWYPFATQASDQYLYLCIDMDPAAGGQVGQVIELLEVERRVLAPSLAAYNERLAADLEERRLILDP